MRFDYVVVGAGSAGCVLANRLSANPANRVLLLEAGPTDWNPLIHMPAGLAMLVNQKGVNWDYSTEPEAQLNQRRLWWPRGKVLGGSSSINAMCYVRGHALDYDDWAQVAPGWSHAQVLPYFKRAEANTRGASAHHGGDGPLGVQDLLYTNPLSAQFIEAAVEAGHPRNSDFNGSDPHGVGYYQVTQRGGSRCSSARAYLSPIRRRPNLKILTGALVEKLLIERKRAVGVQLRHRGQLQRIEAGEVLLSGGAINSPQLLMLSGIGPAEQLRALGAPVAADLRGVGENLQDHLDACTIVHTKPGLTYDHTNNLLIGLNYFLFRSGIGTSNIAEAGGFVRSKLAPDNRPDIQFHFVPAMLDDHGRNRLPGWGVTLHACGLRPRSRGAIRLASLDPTDKPRIHAQYLSDAGGDDLRVLVEAVRLSREIFAQPAFARTVIGAFHPGPEARSDADLQAFIRAKAESIYHPVGTCAMGLAPEQGAVVDPELRVHGIDGLRVVDASVMPSLIGGNTNAPTIMIAERAADLILGQTAQVAAAA